MLGAITVVRAATTERAVVFWENASMDVAVQLYGACATISAPVDSEEDVIGRQERVSATVLSSPMM